MENISQLQEKENSKGLMQMLANGRPPLTEEERITVEEKIKEMEEEEGRYRESKINTSIRDFIGIHYLKNFVESKIRDKGKLDKKIGEMLEEGRGLIILGDIGVGKTMDLVYIFKEISKANTSEDIPVSYYFMPTLFKKLHQGEEANLRKFVMLDDWGREYAEPFALSQFEALIEKMYSKEITLIITTNLMKEQFINREGWARITDRVREMCAILEISGKSRRHG